MAKNTKKEKETSYAAIGLMLIGCALVFAFKVAVVLLIIGIVVVLPVYAIYSSAAKSSDGKQASPETSGIAQHEQYVELAQKEIQEKKIAIEESDNARKEKDRARKKQCDSFTVNDMLQFSDIPIAWSYVMELNHTNGIAWCQLNWNNQKIAISYIDQVNQIIVDAHEYIQGIGHCFVDTDNLDFDYNYPMDKNSMCSTRFECYPYTATGKISKYPVILHFATKWKQHDNGSYTSESRVVGTIKILRDGSIGLADVSMCGNVFKIGLHGTSLVLKRVDNTYTGNLFKFTEFYE